MRNSVQSSGATSLFSAQGYPPYYTSNYFLKNNSASKPVASSSQVEGSGMAGGVSAAKVKRNENRRGSVGAGTSMGPVLFRSLSPPLSY
jgi:hypothetical protein